MKGPCIAIDVSKGKSHICGFSSYEKNISPVKIICHNQDGFSELYNRLESLVKEKPTIIFELTGIYHR